MIGVQAQPTASTPEVGKSYYLYNPKTGKFLTETSSSNPYVTSVGSAWTIIDGSSQGDGYVKLRQKGNDTGFFWGKYWSAVGNNDTNEAYYKPIKQGESNNYKLLMKYWESNNGFVYINAENKDRVAGNSHEQGGLDEAYTLWEFVTEENHAAYIKQTYSYSSNKDVTDFIADAAVAINDAPAWKNHRTNSGQKYTDAPDNYYMDTWNDTRDQYQIIKNLPEGTYKLKAATRAIATLGTGNIYAKVNSTNNNTNIHKDGNTDGELGNGWGWTEVEFSVPSDATVQLGFYSECGGNKWAGADDFTLTLVGTTVKYDAIEFTNGGEMVEGKWYYYDGITIDGDYALTAGSNVTSIIYTTDGTQLTNTTGTQCSASVAFAANPRVYFKSSSTQTLTISYVDPIIENGDYYLYDATNKVFLSRGANYGARAVVDKYGIPFTWNNYSKTIVFKDWTNTNLFITGNNFYTDASGGNLGYQFAFVSTEGGVYIAKKDLSVYGKYDGNKNIVTTASAGEAVVWTVMSKAERDAIVNAYPTDNKTNVIAAASLTSETDAASFETWLAANRAAKDKTDKVGTARFTKAGGKGAWTVTGSASYGDDWTEGFQNAVTWEQTINELAPGIYKVTVNGFERKAGYELCNTLAEEGYEPVTAYFKANDEQLPLASWFSDKTGTNNPDNTDQAATAFNNDKYKNIIYTYVEDAGEGTGSLTLTIKKQDKATGSWVLFNNVTLTYYDTEVSDEERTAILSEATATMASPMKASLYQALATAKSTFEGSNTVPNYNALRTAIDNTATSIASYAAMNTNYLQPMTEFLATTNFVDQTSDAYVAYAGYKDAYDNYTDAETADVENATANALSITKGSGTNYTSTYSLMMLPNWTKNGTAALSNSGFYVNTWSTENKGTGDAKDFANPFYEYWVSSGSLAEATIVGTLTGLKANHAYDVTANVRVMGASKVAGSITMEVEGGTPVDVTAGDAIMDGETPTGRYIKSYTATGVTDADGKLELKFNVAANSNISWLSFRDINCAESEAAISNDFTELNSAISTAEAHTLGFESGEYAPYNNVDALNKLEAAKNLDQNHYYIPSVISSTATTLSEATWTANAGEVNAFYKGDFDGYTEDTTSPLDYTPSGWTATANFRMMLKNVEDYPGLDDASAQTAPMTHPGGITYGEQFGYEMTLKANTYYTLSFKAAGWNNETRSGITVSVLKSGDGLAATNLGTPDRDIKGNATNTAGMTSYKKSFTTGMAGNYVFHIQSGNNFVVSDFELVKAVAEEIKPLLNAEIEKATAIYDNDENVGSGVFQIPVAEWTTFGYAISAAQNVYDNGSATADEVSAAIDALKTAEEAYANVTLNTPDADKAYYIIHAVDGLVADWGTPKLNSDASLKYPVYFVSVGGNSYKISKDKENYVAYKGGDNWSLNTTTTIANAAVCTFAYIGDGKYSITSAKGSFGTDATTAGSPIYGNKTASAANSAWYIYDASANLTVNDGKLGTFIAPFDITLPAGVKAYSATSDAKKVVLKKEYEGEETLLAGTPVIIYGDGVSVNQTFYGDASFTENQTVGALTGILNDSDKEISSGKYVLQTKSETQAFYQLSESAAGKLNRCYVTANIVAGARLVISFDEEDPTAINAIEAADEEAEGLEDGKYLIDGKIVIVKNGVKYSANGQILK